jgi:hypothetical protein
MTFVTWGGCETTVTDKCIARCCTLIYLTCFAIAGLCDGIVIKESNDGVMATPKFFTSQLD